MVESFTISAYDLNTNSLICQIPGNGLSFDWRLNDIGSCSFTVLVQSAQVRAQIAPLLTYNGNPFKVYIDRNGVIVWTGIIWTWKYSRTSGKLDFGGKELLSYFQQRTIAADYSSLTYPTASLVSYAYAGQTYVAVDNAAGFTAGMAVTLGSDTPEPLTILSVSSNVVNFTTALTLPHPTNAPLAFSIDPAALAKQAILDAQNTTLCGPGASIGLAISGGTSSITPITPGYPLSQNTPVYNVVHDMASINQPGAGSVDSIVASSWVTGTPVDTLYLQSPRAGRPQSTTNLLFDLQNVIEYSWPLDATKMGTRFTVTGAGSGTSMVTANVSSGQPVGGSGQLPRLDVVASFSNVQSQSLLSAMASGIVQQYGLPVTTPTITLPTSGSVSLGDFSPGDDARIFSQADEFFPSGLDQIWRIVQCQVSVPDEGLPTMTLTFNQPPTY